MTSHGVDNKEEEIKKVFRETRKIIGMKPIDKAHVEQTMRRNQEEDEGLDKDQRWKKAMNQTVKQFLKFEMKLKQEDMDSTDSKNISPNQGRVEHSLCRIGFPRHGELCDVLHPVYERGGPKGEQALHRKVHPKRALQQILCHRKSSLRDQKTQQFQDWNKCQFWGK